MPFVPTVVVVVVVPSEQLEGVATLPSSTRKSDEGGEHWCHPPSVQEEVDGSCVDASLLDDIEEEEDLSSDTNDNGCEHRHYSSSGQEEIDEGSSVDSTAIPLLFDDIDEGKDRVLDSNKTSFGSTADSSSSSSTMLDNSRLNRQKGQDETGQQQQILPAFFAAAATTMLTASDNSPTAAYKEEQKQTQEETALTNRRSSTVDSAVLPPAPPTIEKATYSSRTPVSISKIAARLIDDDVFARHAADICNGMLDPADIP